MAKRITISEYYNIDALDQLLDIGDFGALSKEKDKDNQGIDISWCLKKIKKDLDGSDCLQKIYVQKKEIGRWYYENGSHGLLHLPNAVRGFICKEGTKDLDAVNCHPTLLLYLFKKNNLNCSDLERYISNRDEILKRCNMSKLDFIIMINSEEYNSKYQIINNIHTIIYKNLIPILKEQKKEIFESIGKKKDNRNGSFISRILQDFEQDVMRVVIEYFTEQNIRFGTFIYDGIHLYDEVDIKKLEEHIEKKFSGINLKFVIKPFDTSKVKELIEKDEDSYGEWKQKWEKDHFYIIKTDQVGSMFYNELMTYKPDIVHLSAFLRNPELAHLFNEKYMKKWLYDTKKRYCRGFDVYPPPLECPDEYINIWKDYDRDKKQEVEIDEEVISTFIKFLKLLSENNDSYVEYLLNYVAHIIQYPGIKPGIALVFASQIQGLGKGTFIRLIQRLIGNFLYQTEDSKSILGQFTASISGKIVINIDESKVLEMYANNSTLKALVTEPQHKIEAKGKDQRMENSFLRIIITTNDENPCKIESDDRRFVVFSPQKKDQDLVEKVINFTDDEIQMIYQYLKKYDIKYKNMHDWQINRPRTKIYIDTKTTSLDLHYQFLLKLMRDKKDNDFEISNKDVLAYFASFLSLIGKSGDKIDARTLGKKLLAVEGIEDINKKINGQQTRMKLFHKSKINKWLEEKGLIDHVDYTGINLFAEDKTMGGGLQ